MEQYICNCAFGSVYCGWSSVLDNVGANTLGVFKTIAIEYSESGKSDIVQDIVDYLCSN